MQHSGMTHEQRTAFNSFLANPEADPQTFALVGAIFILWQDAFNELIDESDARNVGSFSNEIRRIAREYGFMIDDRSMVSADLDCKIQMGEGA
jgi:hypothetical protein